MTGPLNRATLTRAMAQRVLVLSLRTRATRASGQDTHLRTIRVMPHQSQSPAKPLMRAVAPKRPTAALSLLRRAVVSTVSAFVLDLGCVGADGADPASPTGNTGDQCELNTWNEKSLVQIRQGDVHFQVRGLSLSLVPQSPDSELTWHIVGCPKGARKDWDQKRLWTG